MEGEWIMNGPWERIFSFPCGFPTPQLFQVRWMRDNDGTSLLHTFLPLTLHMPLYNLPCKESYCNFWQGTHSKNTEECFVHCQTVNTTNTTKNSSHLSYWYIFCLGENLCQVSFVVSEVSSWVVLYFAYPLIVFNLSLFCGSRPQNGSMILYNRKKVKYRKDGYCWKKRKDGKTTREDHMKLKVQGVEVSVVRGGKQMWKGKERVWERVRVESQPSFWHRQTKVYCDFSPGCNGDSRTVQ